MQGWSLRKQSIGIGVLVLVNLVVRLVWLWYMHPPQVDDFAWYFSHATQMYKGQGYVWYGHPTAYWPIGYPFFLSLLFHVTGPSVLAGLVTNILLSIGIVLLVYGLTLRLSGNPALGFWAAGGYTCLPSQIEWNSVLGSEELFTFLLLMSLFVYLGTSAMRGNSNRPISSGEGLVAGEVWRSLTSGVVMGLAADVRPIVLLWPVVVLGYEWWVGRASRVAFRRAVVIALIFTAGLVAAVAPVTIRNFVAMHHFIVISTNGGVNLWQGTHANGWYYWNWNPKVNPLLPYVKNDYLENKVATHAALQFYLHHPLRTILNGFEKLFFLYWVDWNVVSVTFAEKLPHASSAVIRLNMWLDTIVYYVWMVLSVTGLVKMIRHRGRLLVGNEGTQGQGGREYMDKRIAESSGTANVVAVSANRGWWLLVTYLAYNTAIFFFFPAWDRFRYPMMPLYAVFFAVGAWYIVKRTGRKVT